MAALFICEMSANGRSKGAEVRVMDRRQSPSIKFGGRIRQRSCKPCTGKGHAYNMIVDITGYPTSSCFFALRPSRPASLMAIERQERAQQEASVRIFRLYWGLEQRSKNAEVTSTDSAADGRHAMEPSEVGWQRLGRAVRHMREGFRSYGEADNTHTRQHDQLVW